MYLKWKEQTITDFSDENINSLYNEGFLFTRTGHGDMYQTRSLRIDLNKFELSSENRRVLKKISDLGLQIAELPYEKYDWTIGKMAKDFYETKFGEGTFSANKVKELLTTEHNFNHFFVYSLENCKLKIENLEVGYTICRETNELLHYSYPFYDLQSSVFSLQNIGMGMMLQAILYAQAKHKRFVYLGSAKDAKAKYKLQFEGLEWFDGEKWSDNLEELKNILK
ncbi:MAG TPA: hypothetical protein DEB09_02130 [Candidatus Magasanikbacteria bacterium]|nr:hypothetical protein [Candidatus Magasanikbacteria bacterium]